MNISELKYAQILAANRELGAASSGKAYRIAVLSNVTTQQLNDVLEYALRVDGIHADVESAAYDQMVSGAEKHKDSDLCTIIWELSNIVDGFHYKAASMDATEYETLLEHVEREIQTVFERLATIPLVIINTFSSISFSHDGLKRSRFDAAALRLNQFIEAVAPPNTVLLDIDKIVAELSIAQSFDWRYYYSSKAPYTVRFWKAYAERIAAHVRSIRGKTKKALIFDCDNTLWHGIVGEDGLDGIQMTSDSAVGTCYAEVQHAACQLAAAGVLIGICTKNNEADVDEVLEKHPGMVLRDHIVVRQVNWDDKVSNLRRIAEQLNIGLDSIVFVDDSDFELEMVRQQLPEVTLVRVPERIYDYPNIIRKAAQLFHRTTDSTEDTQRVQMYKEQALRAQEQTTFATLADYLRSLELQIEVYMNDESVVSRVAQLTQKTNQFNLTTTRYTEAEIAQLVQSPAADVISIAVRDRFGSYGTTGVAILRYQTDGPRAVVDSFLMSCRVLGRNIELGLADVLVTQARKRGAAFLDAGYKRTRKNEQVEDLYERLGFGIVERAGEDKRYELNLQTYQPLAADYINVINHGYTN